MANRRQYYGIKFPFTTNNNDRLFIDLNNSKIDNVASEIAHVLLTPKNQRIRKPDYGTDIIKYVFEPNDELTWEQIISAARETVKAYVNNVTLEDVKVVHEEGDDEGIMLDITYNVMEGKKINTNRMLLKL